MDIYAAGLFISLIAYIAIGNYAGRKVRHLEDYFVAGRRAPTLLILGTLIASVNSTGIFIGEVGFSYRGYLGMMILGLPLTSIGYVLGAVYFGRFLRRSRSLTVAEYFGKRFTSPRVRAAAAITLIIGLGGYLMVVTHGVALVLGQVTGLAHWQSLCLAWAGYTFFTFYAGSRGVVITDTIMFLLFTLVAFMALYFVVDLSGGWFTAIGKMATLESRPDLMAWHGLTGPGAEWASPAEAFVWYTTLSVAWGIVAAVSPWQSSRYLMAKDEHVVIRSACLATVTLIILQHVVYFVGGVITLGNDAIDPPDQAIMWAAFNMMPPLIGSVLLAGILAAGLSSASTFLSLIGFSVSYDLGDHGRHGDRQMLRFSRTLMIGVGIVALVIALATPPNIFWITWFVATVFASSWGPVALLSVWSDRVTTDGAFWGIVSGFLGNVLSKLLDVLGVVDLPGYFDPVFIGAVLSIAVILMVSRRGDVPEESRELRRRLHEVPAVDRDPVRTRNSLRAAKFLIPSTALLSPIMLLTFYVHP
ncbi:MAG: sodium:solute symporter family protein [Woeseiaceae bacterium]|nr:sodium:solute symporter family protein [Woeseiaceae bacterium]